MSKFTKEELAQGYERAYSEAKLRTVEVALFLGVHRVTASNYRFKGIGRCDDVTQRRLEVLIKVVAFGLNKKELPLDTSEINGFKQRVTAYRKIVKKYKASLT